MEIKLLRLKLYKMILSMKEFMEKYKMKNNTMNESELEKLIVIIFIPQILKFIQTKDS